MITQFRDECSFLSNFQYFDKPLQLKYQGVILSFPTNEHFYIAMKTTNLTLRKQVCDHPLKGLKKFGNSLPLRDDWDDIKLSVMEYGLRYKFSDANPSLKRKLLATGSQELQEGNWWNDKYWGVCLKTGEGENHLGKLLMEIREEKQNENNTTT
ncbi:hypothetical protein VPH166E361_0079 [Vibrio phage 166E36-1]